MGGGLGGSDERGARVASLLSLGGASGSAAAQERGASVSGVGGLEHMMSGGSWCHAADAGIEQFTDVVLRGPRVKGALDVGLVRADVNPVTGHVGYKGAVVSSVTRLASKARSAQVGGVGASRWGAIR